MRVVTNTEQENAGRYAMKGFAIGAAQWAGVGLFASGLLYSFMPWYRKTQTVNKVSITKNKEGKDMMKVDPLCFFSFTLSCVLV